MMKKYYCIEQKGTDADVYIFGDIVSYKLYDGETSGCSFIEEIKKIDAQNINVHINSCGGSVSEGWVIFNALKENKANVTTYADGFVASAAIYPFLAGNKRIASNVSAFFLHQVLCECYGNADDMRRCADELDIINDIGLNAFEALGIDKGKIKEMQEKETWLTADEALTMGIATKIINAPKEQKLQSVQKIILDKLSIKQEIIPDKKPEEKKEPENELLKFFTRKK